jgi:hypothetical protein
MTDTPPPARDVVERAKFDCVGWMRFERTFSLRLGWFWFAVTVPVWHKVPYYVSPALTPRASGPEEEPQK